MKHRYTWPEWQAAYADANRRLLAFAEDDVHLLEAVQALIALEDARPYALPRQAARPLVHIAWGKDEELAIMVDTEALQTLDARQAARLSAELATLQSILASA